MSESTRNIVCRAGPAAIAAAAQILRDGGLVAFPTETVYGLAADATNSRAVAQIFATKGRPQFNPLIVHVSSLAAAEHIATFSDTARRLAAAFWPGPLTLVLPRRSEAISDLVSAGLPTLAVRVPDHAIAKALLQATGFPLAAPSANRSGHVSATTAQHVADDLGAALRCILDGGATVRGIESTIVGVAGNRCELLRPGAITREQIEAVLGEPLITARSIDAETAPTAPGQLASHYAPRATLRLNARHAESGEALLAFGVPVAHSGPVIMLSATGDVVEAATRLFASLRELDRLGVSRAAVMAIPDHGLGAAINDRLRRAAAPRSSQAG